jgi:ribosome-associated heat shock protein Hsp15
LSGGTEVFAKADRRLDQWLWFARLAKSRSLAARLCSAGAVAVNGVAVRKASQAVHVGDAVALRQGLRHRLVRVLALGARRGPAAEARSLYSEIIEAVALADAVAWTPILAGGPVGEASDDTPG